VECALVVFRGISSFYGFGLFGADRGSKKKRSFSSGVISLPMIFLEDGRGLLLRHVPRLTLSPKTGLFNIAHFCAQSVDS
jgi:hypothetical protein